MKHKIVLAITGASGSIYAKRLIDKLHLHRNQISDVGIVFSKNARDVWQHELQNTDYEHLPFPVYELNNYFAPFASGSAGYRTMVIVPCSMGTLGRIAAGISDDLIGRAADVMLKERRKLILLTRDTPLNLIHLRNMQTLTEAGAIIAPAVPSFYSRPDSIEALTDTVIDRILDLMGLEINTYRWNDE